MDDWKLKARAVVKLKKKHNMFASSCRVFLAVSTVREPAQKRTHVYHVNHLDGSVAYDRIARRW